MPRVSGTAYGDEGGDRLLSRDEIEDLFGLSRRWLELAAWRGDGPPLIRISRRMVRYRRSDVVAWLDARRVGTPGDRG